LSKGNTMPTRTPDKTPTPSQDDRRRYGRKFEAADQLHLVVGSHRLVTINWSPGGCLVGALDCWKIGDKVAGSLESRDGLPMGAVISEIVRIDDRRRAALRFITVAPIF
jgi:hypothetical protein